MTDTSTAKTFDRGFLLALAANFVWINASEVWRYFAIVKPMLHEAFPGAASVAAVTPAIFVSWMVWDTILIFAATGFYWLYFARTGRGTGAIVAAGSLFSITVFGLIWLGIVNMGLAPAGMMWPALPLAWIEQVVAAWIVAWAMGRGGQAAGVTLKPS